MGSNQSLGFKGGIFAIRGDLDGSKNIEVFSGIKQFIGFIIADEEFLLPMDAMNEIIMLNQITYVPRGPNYVEGVVNLRGTILPAVSLRKMMGHPMIPPTNSTRIIVTHNEDIMAGLIVDAITYVVSLNQSQIETPTMTNKGKGAELLLGISKRENKVNGILDISKVFTSTGYMEKVLLEKKFKDDLSA
jgi:purine-binding chemotaxis protein CheW